MSHLFSPDESEKMQGGSLAPISEKEFRKVVRGSEIRYRNEIPNSELKSMLGYRPIERKKRVEMREDGEFESFESITEAGKQFGITAASIKYALDHGREFIKRKKNGKKLFVRHEKN